MNGIEKITRRIDADEQAVIDSLLAAAREQAAQTDARFQAQADAQAADLRARNERNAAQHEERLVGVAELEARKSALAVRGEMVDRAFALALEKLCALPDEQYVKITSAMLAKAATDGKGTVFFSEKDRPRIGERAVAEANKLLGGSGALTLSKETRTLRGGFVLVCGKVEVNCGFETLIRLAKSEMAGEIAKSLFPEN